jgi:hypothetical protein
VPQTERTLGYHDRLYFSRHLIPDSPDDGLICAVPRAIWYNVKDVMSD